MGGLAVVDGWAHSPRMTSVDEPTVVDGRTDHPITPSCSQVLTRGDVHPVRRFRVALRFAVAAVVWFGVDETPAQAAVPLVADNGLEWARVANKKTPVREDDEEARPAASSANTWDMDEAEPAPAPNRKRRSRPADENLPVGRTLLEYLQYGMKVLVPFLVFTDEPYAAPVAQGTFVVGLVGPFVAPCCGYLWLPRIVYGTPPGGSARSAAVQLGFLATVMAWLPGLGCFCYPVPLVGWIGAFIISTIQYRIQAHVLPRAINLAYSDAYGGPDSDEY